MNFLLRYMKKLMNDIQNTETGHTVATMSVEINGKLREVMVAYTIEEQTVRLLTIHPLKEGQKENRLKSGRWRRLE